MSRRYPPLSHCFTVRIGALGGRLGFQQVSGLSSTVEFENINEGGLNTLVHKVPVRTTYSDLTLKRGLLVDPTPVSEWFRSATDLFIFLPMPVIIELTDPRSKDGRKKPLAVWQLAAAVPKAWELSQLDAQQNALAIETMTLSYRNFRRIPV